MRALTDIKKCRRCFEKKQISEFYVRRKNGRVISHGSLCKECAKKGAAEWSSANKDRHNKNTRKWWAENKNKHAIMVAKWARKNRAKLNSSCRLRRVIKKKVTPAWANEFFIEEIYDLALLRTKITGEKWHVDHIVPLQSKLVCGLHTEQNLRVIPAFKNLSKGNKHWPDMP